MALTNCPPCRPPRTQPAQKIGPEVLALAITHVDTEDFPPAVSAHSGCDHDRPKHDQPYRAWLR